MSPVLRELASPESLRKLNEAPRTNPMEMFSFDEGWAADVTQDAGANAEGAEDEPNFFENPQFSGLTHHTLKKYQAYQAEATAANKSISKEALRDRKAQQSTHMNLRIINGDFAGKVLKSPKSKTVRPMMQKVRSALFNMVSAHHGCSEKLPENTRWLDLFAGTGSVGLEALSRGCGECQFIELDPWVSRSVLGWNIKLCNCEARSMTHTMRAEDYLKRAAASTNGSSKHFDFVTVCPPYLLVSYPELQDLLGESGLLGEGTIMFMEYPRQLAHEVRDSIGPLVKVKDRRYGRTWMAVYKAKL